MVWDFGTGAQGGFADRIRGSIQEASHAEELYVEIQGEGGAGGGEGGAESVGAGVGV